MAASSKTRAVKVVIGLGGNRCGRHGRPEAELHAAITFLPALGLRVLAVSQIRQTAPLGPSLRRYANAALLAEWGDTPEALLAALKQLERHFGRRRNRRWGERVLDCDILAFAEDAHVAPTLAIPHPRLAERRFALQPFTELWPYWRHPLLNRTARQLLAQLHKPKACQPARMPLRRTLPSGGGS